MFQGFQRGFSCSFYPLSQNALSSVYCVAKENGKIW